MEQYLIRMYWPSRFHLFLLICILCFVVIFWIFPTLNHRRSGSHYPRNIIKQYHKVRLKTVITLKGSVKYEIYINHKLESYSFPKEHIEFSTDYRLYGNLSDALRSRSYSTKIILAVVDLGYLDLAINLYITSFLQHNLHNFLFICLEKTACDLLNILNIPAYLFINFNDIGKQSSSYFSNPFRKKTHVKTQVILHGLLLGYNILIADVDIVFLKDPFPYLDCEECDLLISSDGHEMNSGFYLVYNTTSSIQLHRNALRLSKHHADYSNQRAICIVLEKMKGKIAARILSPDLFPNGVVYYEMSGRMWPSPCNQCVILHNNWIVTSNAKIYRFKEHGHWFVDRNDYYSSTNAHYLLYTNKELSDYDLIQASFWIAYLLNRTLILPRFSPPVPCKYDVCKDTDTVTFNTLYYVAALDEYLGDQYREHSFLDHPNVPENIKDDIATCKGTTTDIIHRCSQYTNSVLHIESINVDLLEWSRMDPVFGLRLQRAILASDYRQYYKKSVSISWLPARTGSGTVILIITVPIFVIPCLIIAICIKTGICDIQETYQRTELQ